MLKNVIQFQRRIFASFLLERAFNKAASRDYEGAVVDVNRVTEMTGNCFLESLVLKGHLEFVLGHEREAFDSFVQVRVNLEHRKNLLIEDRDYLLLYCIGHYKDSIINSPFVGVEIPRQPNFDRVKKRYVRQFPMASPSTNVE